MVVRQRLNDLGLGTWFQPSVSVQRQGATARDLGDDPVIQPGDVRHSDVGSTAACRACDMTTRWTRRPPDHD